MKYILKWLGWIICLGILGGFIYFNIVFIPQTDSKLNPVIPHDPYAVSDKTQAFHDTLIIADLHADTLLWKRNPTREQSYGHVDLPRLRAGGVDIQIFSAVTQSPRGLNFNQNTADAPDDIKRLALAQMWPPRTWDSIYERAVYQAQRLRRIEKSKKNNIVIARTQADLEQKDGVLVAVLATEGSHPLEGQIENIQNLYDVGYRMMGLQHFFDNRLGGSLHGVRKGGLTEFGRQAVLKMHEMDIIVDVAHSSEQVVRDVLALSPEPIIISHGGITSHCPRTKNRNMPDGVLIQIAERGGVIGIGYFEGVICDISPKGIAGAIQAGVKLLGPDAVALGSDFDGTVTTRLDTSELAAITEELILLGLPETTIRKVMGENVQRFLKDNLPK